MITRGYDATTFILPVPRIKSLRECSFYWGSQTHFYMFSGPLPPLFACNMLGTYRINGMPHTYFKDFITNGIMDNTIKTVFKD